MYGQGGQGNRVCECECDCERDCDWDVASRGVVLVGDLI